MIIDLPRFLHDERPFWDELEKLLRRMEADAGFKLSLPQIKRFHYLYQRASAGLGQINTFSLEPATRRYLETLVARAYGEIHEVRRRHPRPRPWFWFLSLFPAVFRRHLAAFGLSLGLTLLGMAFGAGAILADPDSKSVLLPFSHLQGRPSDRVAWEEQSGHDRLGGHKAGFSAMLMTHNIQVSVLALAMGMTCGVGTIILLFYNGVILGAVCADYFLDGQGTFLCGWLLPHGSIEIPAILIAGQAAFVLARALIGTGQSAPLAARLRSVGPDLTMLIFGAAVMLVWAGIIEAFLSQYHEPVIPYYLKISFGVVELIALFLLLALGGRKPVPEATI